MGAQEGASASSGSSGSKSFEAPTVEVLNQALPAYDVQVLIGQGGMGAVYRARHLKLDRLVAIKVLRPLELDDPALAADFTERFEREARVLAKLDHPHIVRIYDFGHADSDAASAHAFFYLILEYVEGASLRQLMAEGRLSAKEVLELIPQVCEALQAAHSLGVIHRDIKPENILVDGEGRVRIADFGLAKLKGLEPDGLGLTQSHQAFGSVHYMAPEQMRAAGQVDHRADLYSLGVIVYEMLTGELPLGRFAAPSSKASSGTDLDEVVFRALENNPDVRYQGADDLKQDLVTQKVEDVATTEDRKQTVASLKTARAAGPIVTHSGKSTRRQRNRVRRHKPTSQALTTDRQKTPLGSTPGREARDQLQAVDDIFRNWGAIVLLSGMYMLPWAKIPRHEVIPGVLKEAFDNSLIFGGVHEVRAGQLEFFGIPLWIGLMAIIAGAVIRSLAGRESFGPTWLPAALGCVGTAHLGSTLIASLTDGSVKFLTAPFFLALAIYSFNSYVDNKRLKNS